MPEQRQNDGRGTGVVPSQIEYFPEDGRPMRLTSSKSLGMTNAVVLLMLRESIPFLTLVVFSVAPASDGQLGVFVEFC